MLGSRFGSHTHTYPHEQWLDLDRPGEKDGAGDGSDPIMHPAGSRKFHKMVPFLWLAKMLLVVELLLGCLLLACCLLAIASFLQFVSLARSD